jgi:hypothetical protein
LSASSRASLIIISTHYGVDNPFNKLIVDIRAEVKKGKVITIAFDDAIRDGLYERVALVSPKAILSKEEWIADIRGKYGAAAAQELDCIPTQGGASWLDPSMFTACTHTEAGKPELYQKGPAFHGYDVARRRDGIIQWTFEEVGDHLWLREKWERVNVTFRAQREHFGYVMRTYKVLGAGLDQTGMGEPQTEMLQDEWGASRVHGYILSGPQRLALAGMLREEVENGTIHFDVSDETRADLLALKRAGPEGKALMEGPIHADRFWAAAIAVAEARGVRIEYGYTGANEASRNDNFEDDRDARLGLGRWASAAAEVKSIAVVSWGAPAVVAGDSAGRRLSVSAPSGVAAAAGPRDSWGAPAIVTGDAQGRRTVPEVRPLTSGGRAAALDRVAWGAPGLSVLSAVGARVSHVSIAGVADAQTRFLRRQAAIRARRALYGLSTEPDWSALRMATGLSHIINYGQSLSTGEAAGGNTVSTDLSYARMFHGGPRPQDGGADRFDTLDPYREIDGRETPVGGCLVMLAQLLAQEYEIDAATMGLLFLGSSPGQGDTPSDVLWDEAQAYYQRLCDNITYGYARAGDLGVGYDVLACLYEQGESDYDYDDPADDATVGDTWTTNVTNGLDALSVFYQGVTGYSKSIPMALYQTATHLFYSKTYPAIALAQLNLAMTDDRFCMSTPTHFMRFMDQGFSGGGRVHLFKDSYAWMGAYHALALWSWIFHGKKPFPLAPVDARRAAKIISLRYDVKDRRLKWDRQIPNPGNYGFTVVDSSGANLALANPPTIVGRDMVEIQLTANVPAGAKVRAGWIGDGSRGICCLRDDAGDTLTFDLLNLPMHRWAPISETTIA